MNIAIVSWFGCTRCIKEARMLKKAGHTLWLFCNMHPVIPSNIPLESIFFGMSKYSNPNELKILLSELDFIDIVHVHNEPSWMVNVAKDAGCEKVILDAHDLGVVRYGWDNLNESGRQDLQALAAADGLIVPCNKYIDILQEYSQLTIPHLTLYSYVNEEDMIDSINDLRGIVYEGSIYAPAPNHPFPYRIYSNVASSINKMEIPFFIYPGRGYQDCFHYYRSLGSNVMPTCDPGNLLKNLSRHSWGFCGSPIKHRQWDNTLSNKFYEYMAAGIPSFIYKAQSTEEEYGDKGIAVVINDLEEIKDIYNNKNLREELVLNIKKTRFNYSMESQSGILTQFYETVLNS